MEKVKKKIRRRFHRCYLCKKRETKYQKLYLKVYTGFFELVRTRFHGVNIFWICDHCYNINKKNILYENLSIPFRWILYS